VHIHDDHAFHAVSSFLQPRKELTGVVEGRLGADDVVQHVRNQ